MFNFGSTIVLLFTAKSGLEFNIEKHEKLKVGQRIFPKKLNNLHYVNTY